MYVSAFVKCLKNLDANQNLVVLSLSSGDVHPLPLCSAAAARVQPGPEERLHAACSLSSPVQSPGAWHETGEPPLVYTLHSDLSFRQMKLGVLCLVIDFYSPSLSVCDPVPRHMALRSCAQSAGCRHQSLMPPSAVTLSGKASWIVWRGTATSRLGCFEYKHRLLKMHSLRNVLL